MEKTRPEALFCPLLHLGPASRPSILAKTPRSLNLGTSENFVLTEFGLFHRPGSESLAYEEPYTGGYYPWRFSEVRRSVLSGTASARSLRAPFISSNPRSVLVSRLRANMRMSTPLNAS